jgi:tetratricopeptide (TPR) repeat protein
VTYALSIFVALLLFAADNKSPGLPAYEKANSLFVAKNFPDALVAVEEALRLDPKLVPALTLHAKMAMAANRFDVAQASLEQAIKVAPSSGYAQFLYGLNFYLANDLKMALPQFEKVRQLEPNDPRAALYLGLTNESLGKTAEAMALYEEAVRLEERAKSPQAETYLTGARLLFLLGRLDQCETWVRAALKLSPKSREGHFEFARLLLEKDDLTRAAQEGEAALLLPGAAPTEAQIHYLLIRAHRTSNPEQAARHAAAVRNLDAK